MDMMTAGAHLRLIKGLPVGVAIDGPFINVGNKKGFCNIFILLILPHTHLHTHHTFHHVSLSFPLSLLRPYLPSHTLSFTYTLTTLTTHLTAHRHSFTKVTTSQGEFGKVSKPGKPLQWIVRMAPPNITQKIVTHTHTHKHTHTHSCVLSFFSF